MQYKAIKLVKRPDLHITPDLFEVVTLETPELEDGQMLLKQTHMSLDPAMKGWMTDDRNSYIPPVELGEVMRSSGVAEVVESRNRKFSAGDRVSGMIGWTEYAVSTGQGLQKLPPGVPAGGHGGSHGNLMHEFVSAILEDREPMVNVYEALAMTVPGIIAHQSALKDGERLKIPQFERPEA